VPFFLRYVLLDKKKADETVVSLPNAFKILVQEINEDLAALLEHFNLEETLRWLLLSYCNPSWQPPESFSLCFM